MGPKRKPEGMIFQAIHVAEAKCIEMLVLREGNEVVRFFLGGGFNFFYFHPYLGK